MNTDTNQTCTCQPSLRAELAEACTIAEIREQQTLRIDRTNTRLIGENETLRRELMQLHAEYAELERALGLNEAEQARPNCANAYAQQEQRKAAL